ncbi:menaquinol-cytochrome c reductase cytochrome b subunit [Acidimicrobiia bacterium EGI L10123]|uniref:menaquinol-cytochrome c reductase cytochrome b subunit n=1 Tax=Salinilacustrithrix flava TaxID=2957203 RepID=UPI003D7C34F6|nr:menaquinol-cytochrome c reductase cytochrome b subunit [Acidimicrobiia bacterium EGI L10123]
MTEIPEHLRKRAEEARKKAEAESAPAGDAAGAEQTPEQSEAESRIPAHLLERSKAAKAKAAGGDAAAASGGGGGTAVATAPAAAAAVADGGPLPTGPGGHTQRLLTVVKAGSIQDVRATPLDKVHTWPHLLVVEFVAALAVTAFLLFFSIFVNAPLLELANFNETPNPSKAPWYFLGLQELLTMFHPMVAGVTIPGMGMFALMLAPYTDRNPSNKPTDRKYVISLMTMFLMFWAVLVIIGSFFRGPGFNFVFPWNAGLFFEL